MAEPAEGGWVRWGLWGREGGVGLGFAFQKPNKKQSQKMFWEGRLRNPSKFAKPGERGKVSLGGRKVVGYRWEMGKLERCLASELRKLFARWLGEVAWEILGGDWVGRLASGCG